MGTFAYTPSPVVGEGWGEGKERDTNQEVEEWSRGKPT